MTVKIHPPAQRPRLLKRLRQSGAEKCVFCVLKVYRKSLVQNSTECLDDASNDDPKILYL